MTKIHNSRMTRQRRLILEELRKVKSHPTADKVYELVKKRMPTISLGTVYRNLELLADQGEIQKVGVDSMRMHFDGTPKKHDHIRCIKCHRIDDISVSSEISWNDIKNECDYEILGHKVEFYGLCPECRKKATIKPE